MSSSHRRHDKTVYLCHVGRCELIWKLSATVGKSLVVSSMWTEQSTVMTQFTMLRHVQSTTTNQVNNNTGRHLETGYFDDISTVSLLGSKSALFSCWTFLAGTRGPRDFCPAADRHKVLAAKMTSVFHARKDNVHCESKKLRQMSTDFQNSFTVRLSTQFKYPTIP